MVSSLDCVNNGKLLAESGTTRVYKLNGELYMTSGIEEALISSEDDLRNYIWQLGKKPFGNVLVLGLGLGFNVKYILSLPRIDSITVVEPNNDVITCQQKCSQFEQSDNVVVIDANLFKYLYETRSRFDFIFVDCYRQIDNTTWPFVADLVVAARRVCKVNGVIVGWLDESASEYWLKAFQTLF